MASFSSIYFYIFADFTCSVEYWERILKIFNSNCGSVHFSFVMFLLHVFGKLNCLLICNILLYPQNFLSSEVNSSDITISTSAFF